MAIDPANLTQSELLQLVNATPMGVVLTRSRLRRQMDAGALKFGDGTRVHLVRYARWLAGEMDRPRPPRQDYNEARRKQAHLTRLRAHRIIALPRNPQLRTSELGPQEHQSNAKFETPVELTVSLPTGAMWYDVPHPLGSPPGPALKAKSLAGRTPSVRHRTNGYSSG